VHIVCGTSAELVAVCGVIAWVVQGNNAQAGLYGLTGLVFVGFPVLLTGLYNMVFGTNKRQPGQ
jgi:hypothetical protein